MGSSTSTEERPAERRPNTKPSFSYNQPSTSNRPQASGHQSTVSYTRPKDSPYRQDILYREPPDSSNRPQASGHQSNVSYNRPEDSPYRPDVSHRKPSNSIHQPTDVQYQRLRGLRDQRRQETVPPHEQTVSQNATNEQPNAGALGDAFVRDALEKCNSESVLQIFVDNEIDKTAFLLLTEDDLKTLLPTKMGPRKKIWDFIQSIHDATVKPVVTVPDDIDSVVFGDSEQTQPHKAESQGVKNLKLLDGTEDLPQHNVPHEIPDPHSELTTLSPNPRTDYSSSFYDCGGNDDGTNRSTVDPPASQLIVNRMNQLTFNMQFINQRHNQFPEPNNFGTTSTQFVSEDEEETQDTAYGAGVNVMPDKLKSVKTNVVEQVKDKPMNHKPKEYKNVNRGSVTASHKQRKSYNDKHQHSKQSTSKKVPHFISESTRKLPIYAYKTKFLELVEQNPVVIVIAETGSGKSTQMPQYLARANYDKKIICTQPRRLAAKSLANRVAYEFGTKLGQQVGYRVRFDNCTENTTKISYVTEGVLVHELSTDITATDYSVVIIDEAHERNLNTDVLLGCLKKAVASRPDLKVVISSATVEAKKFSKFFNYAPVLDIPGRSFPVDIIYTGRPDPDYLTAVTDNVCRIHRSQKVGDILVFLPGQEEIEHIADTITEQIRERPNSFLKELVLPLYSKLPSEQQNLIFEPAPPNTRKIILATNIAETSLTIDGIVFVVDSGLVKQAEYMTKANGVALECTTLVTIPITKAQAKQRSGRAGRTQPGVAYRLYSEATYNAMAEAPTPEILRGNLEMVVLLLFSMGVKNILKFDFLDSPPSDALLTALEKLQEFEALTKSSYCSNEYSITSIGRQMSSFPLEPYLSKMLIMSADLGCSEEMLTIIAILSAQVEKLFKRPRKKKMEADLKKKTFDCPEGDHVTLLNVYNQWMRQSKKESRGWCREFHLDWKTLEEAYEIRCQLATMLDEKKIARKSCGADMTKVQIAIASGSFRKIAWKTSRYAYYTFSSPTVDPVHIHPSSVLFTDSPSLVIYNSIIKTKKAYMSQVLQIEIEYIKQYAPNFYAKLARVMPGGY